MNDFERELVLPGEIDSLIHEPTRLMIISYLYVREKADLIYFKRQTNLSWGNISTHASKLEKAGYLKIDKEFRNKKPVTTLELTKKGRKVFDEYRNTIKKLIN